MARERGEIHTSLNNAMFLEVIAASQQGLNSSNLQLKGIASHLLAFCSRASAVERIYRGDKKVLADTLAYVDHREVQMALRTVGISYEDVGPILESVQTAMQAVIQGVEASPEDLEHTRLLIDGFNHRAQIGAYKVTKD